MFLRWITAAYLAYLVVPIALLLAGSFGELWLNTILPTGLTTQWYRDVAADPSFRRAFTASLAVVAITCAACAAIGLPLAYAVFRTESPRVRALARVLYQMPVALPPLVLAFGFILVFSSDTLPWLGSIWLLAAGHVVLALPYFLQTVVADMQRLALRTPADAADSPARRSAPGSLSPRCGERVGVRGRASKRRAKHDCRRLARRRDVSLPRHAGGRVRGVARHPARRARGLSRTQRLRQDHAVATRR